MAKHTCGGPVFGKMTDGCPRCEELKAGAPAIQQPWRAKYTPEAKRRERDAFREQLAREQAKAAREGRVCTFGEW